MASEDGLAIVARPGAGKKKRKGHKSTPPAYEDTLSPRATPPDCDETTQKDGAPLPSSASSSASSSIAPSQSVAATKPSLISPRAHDEPALSKPAHEAQRELETKETKGAKQASADGVTASSAKRTFPKPKRATSDELRRRFYDPNSNSFPKYGNPKDGIPIPDPMSAGTRLRSVLAGSFSPTLNSKPSHCQNKRSAQPSETLAELPRFPKRQKTAVEDENLSPAGFSQSRFALAPLSPVPAPSTTAPSGTVSSVVDLTESQISGDVEILSNRSNHDPASNANAVEFRNVEKANSIIGGKRPRRRKLLSQRSSVLQDNDDEDDLGKEEPSSRILTNGATGAPRPPVKRFGIGRAVRRTPEGISDSELDELALLTDSSRKRHHALVDQVSDDTNKTSLSAPSRRQARGDIARVEFSSHKKQKVDPPSLRVKRAVSGPHTLEVDDSDTTQYPTLQGGGDPNQLIVAHAKDGQHDFRWLEVKLNFCTEIMYTTARAPIALIRRPARPNTLVIEFAKEGDAFAFATWAQQRLAAISNLKIKVEAKDSDHLRRIFDKQWSNAINHKPNPRSQPDDIKLLEHNEARRATGDLQTLQQNSPRPSSSQQNTPYRSAHSLRSGMNTEGSVSTPTSLYKTRSGFASEEKDTNSEPRRTRDLPPRSTRDAATRRILDVRPNVPSPRSPSPVQWMDENPCWTDIWDDRPLIFPATGKNRASVYKEDIGRLEEGQYMNDNLIGFYLRYLQLQLEEENRPLADRIYFMNTYFYQKLTEKSGRGINYDGVRTWTAKVDLFSFDYIVVPVNEAMHWYLVIICHPSKLLKSKGAEAEMRSIESAQEPQKEGLVSSVGQQVEQMSLDDANMAEDGQKIGASNSKTFLAKPQTPRKGSGTLARSKDPSEVRAITLDSMGGGHSATCGNLKEYLVRELKDKKDLEIEPPAQFGMTAKNIPEQLDATSCGAFLLGYLREFLKNPDEVIGRLVRKEKLDWPITSPAMRGEVRSIIIEQRKEQNERNQRMAAEKKAKRKSNIKAPVPIESPEAEPKCETATPSTPKPAVDVPKNPSSTVKGSPVISSNDRLSSPIKKATNGEANSASDSGLTYEPTNSTASKGLPSYGVSSPTFRGPNIPHSEQPSSRITPQPEESTSRPRVPTPPLVRTSPRQNKGKSSSSAARTKGLLGPIPSSSPPTVAAGNKKPEANVVNNGLQAIDSSSPCRPIRAGGPISYDGSISPSQQLLGEEQQSSPSKSTRKQKSVSQVIEDNTEGNGTDASSGPTHAKKSSPRTMLKDGTHVVSPYFSASSTPHAKSSPLSARKAKQGQLSLEEVSKQPRPSIETVDLTVN